MFLGAMCRHSRQLNYKRMSEEKMCAMFNYYIYKDTDFKSAKTLKNWASSRISDVQTLYLNQNKPVGEYTLLDFKRG